MQFLIAIAVLIILVLSIIAVWMVLKVKKAERRRDQLQKEIDAFSQKARKEINNSIQIIARSLLDGQVQNAEASIRVSALLNQLSVDEKQRQDYVAFDKLANAVSHIPILEEWKALPKQKRKSFEVELAKLEDEYDDFIKDAAQKIIGQSF